VETGYKGRGMGAGLFDEMMQAISNSGRQRVVMACIRSNTRMIALASKARCIASGKQRLSNR
jgi:L-amino acid N-acyltransferase YncA